MLITNYGNYVSWEYESGNNRATGKYKELNSPSPRSSIEELHRLVLSHKTSSFYFPTFRRIVGGYSMGGNAGRVSRQMSNDLVYYHQDYASSGIQRELEALSNRISVNQHTFVSSISTNDIVLLLTERYATISESLNSSYKELSTSIIDMIREVKSKTDNGSVGSPLSILNEIQRKADGINDLRDGLLRPFTVLSELTEKLFRHKGIRIQAVTLGEAVDAIDSTSLSAGEKQMLSFLCYNAFSENSIIFIDEPELSLHPDWQRKIFRILLRQQPSNQFVVATHSPFIYSKYEDKEIVLSEDKGA